MEKTTSSEQSAYSLNPQAWIESYADDLFRYAFFHLKGDREKAEDLVQDTFLSALEKKETYKGMASEKTWLFSILKNKLLDYFRKASTQKEIPLPSGKESDREISLDFFYNPKKNGRWHVKQEPSEWNNSEKEILEKERNTILKKCLELLPEKWRRIFADTYLECKKGKDICKEWTISASNYWVILHRTKVQLRECVERTLKR